MSEFVLKRGLCNVFIAEVTADTETEFTVGTPKKLIPAGEMSKTVDNESTLSWYDNGVFATVGREGATEITITGAGLRAAARAYINGKMVDEETGAVIDSGQFTEKYFALGGETESTDGTKEYFWFMKGTFAIPNEADKTKDESTDTNGTELTYKAVATNHVFDKTKEVCKRVVIDTETTVLKADQIWNAQVVTPENLATIVEKKTA